MWPVRNLRLTLPEHLLVEEDPDLAVLRCTRCGWVMVFAVGGATVEALRAAAATHATCGRRTRKRQEAHP